MTKEKLDWYTIDTDELPETIDDAYDAYKAAAKLAKEAREEFEVLLREAIDVPKGKEAVFAYRFGKVSVAFKAAERKAKPKSSNVIKLAI